MLDVININISSVRFPRVKIWYARNKQVHVRGIIKYLGSIFHPQKSEKKKKGEKPFTPITLHSAEVKERQVPPSSVCLSGSRYKATVTRTEQVWRSAARRLSGPLPPIITHEQFLTASLSSTSHPEGKTQIHWCWIISRKIQVWW